MKLNKLTGACALAIAAMFGAAAPAQAQISGDVIKVGFITDMAGVYGDIDGMGGVEAIRMAIADMGGTINGKKIEVMYAEHQNKADVAAAKAREWFDTQGLDMLVGGTNSGTALAMAKVAAEKKKPFLVVGAASSALTNEQCNPYTVHWAYDTVALAKGTGNAVVKAGRQVVVLPASRLRVRRCAAGRRVHRCQGRGRHRRRHRQAPAVGERLLVLPVAGPGQQGPDPGDGQCRRRHHQHDQGGQRVRRHEDDEARRPAGLHQRHPLARV